MKRFSKNGAFAFMLAFTLPLVLAGASSVATAQSQDDAETSQTAPQNADSQKINRAQQLENGNPCYPGSPLFYSPSCPSSKAVAAPPIKSPMTRQDVHTIAEILQISERASEGSSTASGPVEEANAVWPASILPQHWLSKNPKAPTSDGGIQYPLRESDSDDSGTK